MIPTERALPSSKIAVLIASLTLFCLLLGPGAGTALAVHYTKESIAAYEQQLASGQIASATFNKKVRSVHLLLKSGEYVLIHYGAGEQKKYQEQLTAKGVPVTIQSKAQANKEAKTPVKHKLRYIVGGILVVVVLIVGAVLLVDRRRKAVAE